MNTEVSQKCFLLIFIVSDHVKYACMYVYASNYFCMMHVLMYKCIIICMDVYA